MLRPCASARSARTAFVGAGLPFILRLAPRGARRRIPFVLGVTGVTRSKENGRSCFDRAPCALARTDRTPSPRAPPSGCCTEFFQVDDADLREHRGEVVVDGFRTKTAAAKFP